MTPPRPRRCTRPPHGCIGASPARRSWQHSYKGRWRRPTARHHLTAVEEVKVKVSVLDDGVELPRPHGWRNRRAHHGGALGRPQRRLERARASVVAAALVIAVDTFVVLTDKASTIRALLDGQAGRELGPGRRWRSSIEWSLSTRRRWRRLRRRKRRRWSGVRLRNGVRAGRAAEL